MIMRIKYFALALLLVPFMAAATELGNDQQTMDLYSLTPDTVSSSHQDTMMAKDINRTLSESPTAAGSTKDTDHFNYYGVDLKIID